MNDNYEISDDVKILIVSYLQGSSTKGEALQLKQWLETDDRNKEYFTAMKESWFFVEKTSNKPLFDNTLLWNSLKARMDQPGNTSFKNESRSINYQRIIRIAATWLLIFILGSSLSYWFVNHKTYRSVQLTSISSPLGSKSHILLPDGSSVWLNAGSTIEYNGDFNSATRELKLTGEAFFNVTSNKSKPFIVNAQNISIKAFGTAFNVKAYSEEKKVVTTLVEGVVKIEGKDDQQKPFSITMEPKQKVTYYADKNSLTIDKAAISKKQNTLPEASASIGPATVPALMDVDVKTELYTSWKDSRWIVQGEKFKDLALMLGRRFNITININSDELDNYRFSGTIENETPEQVMEILRYTIPIDYTIDKGVVNVKVDKKLKEKYKGAY